MYKVTVETKKSVNSQPQIIVVETPSLNNALNRALKEVAKLSNVFYAVLVVDDCGTFFYASIYNGLEI